MNMPKGTPQQIAQMTAFRDHQRKSYTEQMPRALSFSAEVELLEAMIRPYWSREDARAFMVFVVDCSWSTLSPHTYVKEVIVKLVAAIQQGQQVGEEVSLEAFQASGLFEMESSLVPVDNIPAEHLPYHELLAFEDQQKARQKPSFKDSINAMRKNLNGFPRRNSN